MSESKIRRKSKSYSVTLQTAEAAVTAMPIDDMAGGMVHIGTVNTAFTQLDLYVSDSTSGSFYQLYDKDGTAVKVTVSPSTVAGRAYAMPDEVFAAKTVKLVASNTAGTGVAAIVMFKG